MPHKLAKPDGPNLIQWDASNLSTLQSELTAVNFVLTGSDLTADGTPVNLTDWVGFNAGAYVLTNTDKEAAYQDIPVDGEFAFASDLTGMQSTLDGIDVPERRKKDVAVPALLLGASQTLTVTWDTAMPSADYMISVVPVGAASIVDSVSWSVVGSSMTASGLQIAVKAGLLVAVGTITLRVFALEV
jgi:hypothetical protein